ncbi:ABC transporter substrate-binding protein [Bordetella trematum]|uniref:ABC transporter substrate-binding protein n=1 Tax=Bordetella trematum TaxID=123899 RepID=A0A157SCL6_9BORD|nr:ABC transporter substrate-binding protein [Bordetella trematum]AUL48880.1 ABC transporter substrate-binding protein [Bordetella trematum]AZR95822.1 ABC transporter substrate-binding protein [Bordetella trematum]NNH18745.1 extracellular solute-binding protein [Bordetella trematum]CZZ88474.1 ABC transporter substrate-binding protein [Bordetella trematum]SAI10455.1 ABC transporter substrate-binding protein [Bordetella trematum]
MKRMLTAALAALAFANVQAQTANAICYNCPPEWADWGTALKAIKARTGVTVPADNKNSGQALASLAAERKNPVADVVYYGVSFGIQAAKDGLVQPYKPALWNDIPDGMKDPDGKWFAIHSGTLGFMVNVDALNGKPVPASWADLLKPEYRGMVGYLDPASAFVGYVGAVAVNQAMGGTLDDFTPGLEWFRKMQQNKPIVPKQTSYARVLSGEIPILIDYDFNAYRAKYKDQANVAFVIPAEGTIAVPYVMSLVADAPHADNGRKVLDFTLSDEGQTIWAEAFLRPVRPGVVSPQTQAKFLPASEYARAKTVDYAQMANAQRGFSERYAKEVQ